MMCDTLPLFPVIIAVCQLISSFNYLQSKYGQYMNEEVTDCVDHDGNAEPSKVDMASGLVIQSCNLAYYLHIWILKGLAFQLADGVLLLVVRKTLLRGAKVISKYYAAKDIGKGIKESLPPNHAIIVLLIYILGNLVLFIVVSCVYVHSAKNIDKRFPDAAPEDLAALTDDEVCAICLKSMKFKAKKLPCSHLFHSACIRQCMEKGVRGEDPRCPLCRYV